jgi:TonB family protein
VEITVLRSGVPQSFPGRTLEVGLGGLSLVVAADLFAGEPVGVVLTLAGGESIRSRGRVCYQDRLRGGIQFVLPSRLQSDSIHQWALKTQATLVSKPEFQRPEPQAPRFLDSVEPFEPMPETTGRKRWLPLAATLGVLAVAVVVALALWAWHPARTPASAASRPISTRVIVPSEIMRSQILYRTVPEYPETARRNGIEGIVALAVVVDKSGRVVELRPMGGPPVLSEAAAKAVQQWRFAPFLVGGEPVEAETTIEVGFRLTDK